MLCSQCGAPADRCARCAGALCQQRLCAELHEASCAAVSALPSAPLGRDSHETQRGLLAPAPVPAPAPAAFTPRARRRRERTRGVARAAAEELVQQIPRHRQYGHAALLAGELDTAFHELWAARELEPELDELGATARLSIS